MGLSKNTFQGLLGATAPSYSGVWNMDELFGLKNISLLNFTSSSTDTNIHTYPSTISSGNILIGTTVDDGSSPATFPAGWVEILSITDSNPRTKIAYKIADGTETGTFTITSDSNVICNFTGFKLSSNIEYGTAFDSGGSGVTSVPVSITTTKPGLLVAVLAFKGDQSAATVTNTDGMTLEVNQSLVNLPSVRVLTQPSLRNTTYNKTFTTSGSNTKALLINLY